VWLLATLVAPAVTGSPVADETFSVEVEGGSIVRNSAYAWLPPMQLDGDSECGGSGGCPNLF
jgi:hypothetical protein